MQHVGMLSEIVELPRSLKGKVQRVAALKLLERDTEQIYREAELAGASIPSDLDFSSQGSP